MNKSLFTLATLSAFAAGAYAQSSVTLFGVLDVNAAQIKNGSAGSLKSLSQGALNTSRLGLRGSEDLGGGLSAGFHLEGQVNPDNGTMTSVFWNRRSTVSLIGSWGELRLGRDYNPSSRNTYLFEPYIGTSVGTVLNFTLAPTATLGSGATTALRTNNAVAYFLPKGLGGLYGVTLPPKPGSLAEWLNSGKESGSEEGDEGEVHAGVQARGGATGQGWAEHGGDGQDSWHCRADAAQLDQG